METPWSVMLSIRLRGVCVVLADGEAVVQPVDFRDTDCIRRERSEGAFKETGIMCSLRFSFPEGVSINSFGSHVKPIMPIARLIMAFRSNPRRFNMAVSSLAHPSYVYKITVCLFAAVILCRSVECKSIFGKVCRKMYQKIKSSIFIGTGLALSTHDNDII
jgi:hypothetical protein